MYKIFKRFFDIIIASLAILLLSPFLIIISILLLLTGEHNIFYLQERVGYRNKSFRIIKFATMLQNSPNIGTGSITLRNDPRVLPFGRFLRKTKINELPQVFNVLIGDMSIVGPRPQMQEDLRKFPKIVQERMYDSKPGITGIGSVIFRDEEKLISNSDLPPHQFYEKEIAPYKGELELWYNQYKSLKVDLILIFLTGWVILFPDSQLVYKLLKRIPRRLT